MCTRFTGCLLVMAGHAERKREKANPPSPGKKKRNRGPELKHLPANHPALPELR